MQRPRRSKRRWHWAISCKINVRMQYRQFASPMCSQDTALGSWADEMENTPVPSATASGYGGERRAFSSAGGWGDRSGSGYGDKAAGGGFGDRSGSSFGEERRKLIPQVPLLTMLSRAPGLCCSRATPSPFKTSIHRTSRQPCLRRDLYRYRKLPRRLSGH